MTSTAGVTASIHSLLVEAALSSLFHVASLKLSFTPLTPVFLCCLCMLCSLHLQADDPVVILGFGPQGQMVANMVSSPFASSGQAYIGFDLEPSRVDASRQAGFLVQYGDGSRSDVLKAAGETE